MSAIFESLKKLDQKAKAVEQINPSDALPLEPATVKSVPLIPERWVVISLVALGIGWLALAVFGHVKYREISEFLSAQHSSFVSRLDQLSRQIEGLEEKLGSLETAQQVSASRLQGLSQRIDQERQSRSEAVARHDILIAEQKTSFRNELDERFQLLSERIDALAEPPQAESYE